MAGEIEEPFSFSFRADSLHSGSISFGRFETEPFSWERRSSFSHNRYLEEVEKCSKPGSVIEKKAYFEAHFKKRGGFLPQNSPKSYSGTEYQNSENDTSETADCEENFDRGSQGARFDESPEHSECYRDQEVIECEKEDPETSIASPPIESALNYLMDGALKPVNTEELDQNETGCDKLLSVDYKETGREIKQDLNNRAVNVNEPSEAIYPSSKTGTEGKDNKTSSERQRTPSSKLMPDKEIKALKQRVKSPVNTGQIRRNISCDAHKSHSKFSNRREVESLHRLNIEKKSSQTAITTTHTVRKTPQVEDSRGLKAKLIHDGKSITGRDSRKVRESHSSSLMPDVKVQNASRVEHVVKSAKIHASPSAAKNRIQLKTQEKADVASKKFPKSLNFRAKPMPSFYNIAVLPGLNGKKAVSSSTIAPKARKMSTSPGSEARDINPAPSTSRYHSAAAGSKVNVVGKKERLKNKDPYVQKHGVLESCRVIKGQRVEGKPKAASGRNAIKGVAVGSSEMGRLTIGVTS